MRISDWSSDVCSSDLFFSLGLDVVSALRETVQGFLVDPLSIGAENLEGAMFSGYFGFVAEPLELFTQDGIRHRAQHRAGLIHRAVVPGAPRSEEHTSELQSLMRISYSVFCLTT